MFFLAGIVFSSIVVADLSQEQGNDRKFGLEIKLSYGGKATGSGVQNKKYWRQGNIGRAEDGEWDSQGYVYHARARGRFKLHTDMVTWKEARQKCYDEGGELASPESEVLLETLSSIMITSHKPPLIVFIGINDLYSKGFFRSIKGIALKHMPIHWAPDKHNMGRQNCLALHRNGLLYGENCVAAKRQYICYKRDVQIYDMLCGPDYIHYKTTHACYKWHSARSTWTDAYATCAREDARLLIVNTDDEAEIITALFKKSRETAVHLGATWWKKDVYMTIDGEPLDMKRFYGYLPTFEESAIPKAKEEQTGDCLMLLNELFHKVNCTARFEFVCEKTPNRY